MKAIIAAVVLTALEAYLIGSINTAILVTRACGKGDIRQYGSGNAGMTNVLRTLGKIPAAITAAGDFLKGIVAILLGRGLFSLFSVTAFDAGYLAGFFVLIGHLFPLYFGLKGGKGIVTSLGIILMMNPIVFCILIALFVPMAFLVKIVSLASICGVIAYPIFTLIVDLLQQRPLLLELLFAIWLSAVTLFMHRSNIKRLLNGTEPKFGQKK